MVALKIIWTFIKNPKNLAICVLATLFLFFAWKSYSLQNTYAKEKIAYQDAQLKMADRNQKAIQDMNKKWKENAIVTGKLTEQIKSLKIEGKCIKDENYYNTAGDIVKRFNDSLY
jgi:predicted negative regulator of RcsB-dependent stress response